MKGICTNELLSLSYPPKTMSIVTKPSPRSHPILGLGVEAFMTPHDDYETLCLCQLICVFGRMMASPSTTMKARFETRGIQ